MSSGDQEGLTPKEMGLTEKDISADKAHKTPDRTTGKPEHANPYFKEESLSPEERTTLDELKPIEWTGDQKDESAQLGTREKSEIILQETYDGQEDPWVFLERLAAQTREKGYQITAQEMLSQLETQAREEGSFSFDSMATSAIRNILRPGTVITVESVPASELPEDSEIAGDEKITPKDKLPELPQDENINDLLRREDKKTGEGRKEKKTELADLKEVFNSPQGKELDGYLVKIKEAGQSLMAELTNCKGVTESDQAKQSRLNILDDLKTAEGLEKEIKNIINQDFGVSLTKELVPSYNILACVKQGYQDNQVTMTEQGEIFNQVTTKGEKLSTVIEKVQGNV